MPSWDADLEADSLRIADAVAKLGEAELRAIVIVANEAARMAAGLVSWLEQLVDCEVNRRAGLEFNPQPTLAGVRRTKGRTPSSPQR